MSAREVRRRRSPLQVQFWPLLFLTLFAVYVLGHHLYGNANSLPNRHAKRDVVVPLDYDFLQQVFSTHHLPESFRVTGVHHYGLGAIPSPDGPPPVHYRISLDARDLQALLKTLGSFAVSPDDAMRGFWAAKSFQSPLSEKESYGSVPGTRCYSRCGDEVVVDEE